MAEKHHFSGFIKIFMCFQFGEPMHACINVSLIFCTSDLIAARLSSHYGSGILSSPAGTSLLIFIDMIFLYRVP